MAMARGEGSSSGDPGPGEEWRLLGCDNGLRFFQRVPSPEAAVSFSSKKQLTALKAVTAVDASPSTVCSRLLDYGPTRLQWDASLERAQVVETKEDKSDVLQLTLRPFRRAQSNHHSSKLLLLRWWTKLEDGSFVVVFRCLPNRARGKQLSCSRSSQWLECGAFFIRPLAQEHSAPGSTPGTATATRTGSVAPGTEVGAQKSLVELVLETHELPHGTSSCLCCSAPFWGCPLFLCSLPLWTSLPSLFLSHPRPALATVVSPMTRQVELGCYRCCLSRNKETELRDALLYSLAGLKEFCASGGPWDPHAAPPSIPPTGHLAASESLLTQNLLTQNLMTQSLLTHSLLTQTQLIHPLPLAPPFAAQAMDRVVVGRALGTPERSASGLTEPLLKQGRSMDSLGRSEEFKECVDDFLSDAGSEGHAEGHAEGHVEGPEIPAKLPTESPLHYFGVDWCKYQGSLPHRCTMDTPTLANCWLSPPGSGFSVKGETFFGDGRRVPAGTPQCQLVAVDWLQAEDRIEGVAEMKGGVVQRVVKELKDKAPFFLVMNLQVPAGKRYFSLVCYFAIPKHSASLAPGTLLHTFAMTEDDAYRRNRLTLIPAIPEGSWLVRNAVGTGQRVPLAQVLETTFSSGESYLEMGINMGTSAVVRGVIGLVIPAASYLTVDMAFLVKAERGDVLPEELFGCLRACNLDLNAAAVYSADSHT